MRDAWRYYWFQAQVNTTTMVNGFIYFLRRIPFLGKRSRQNGTGQVR